MPTNGDRCHAPGDDVEPDPAGRSYTGRVLISRNLPALRRTVRVPVVVACTTSLLLGGTACAGTPDERSPDATHASADRDGTGSQRLQPIAPDAPQVVVVSIDGLPSKALSKYGRKTTPVLHRLLRRGAGTTNARTARERTETLPNHTGMVTSRRINPRHGGHGVTWNDDRAQPATISEAAGSDVESVFSQVKAAGGRTVAVATKTKFSLWKRSWPTAFDKFRIASYDDGKAVRVMVKDLTRKRAALRFLHLSDTDKVGHARGYLTPAYRTALARADRRLGRVVTALPDDAILVVTTDHGGRGRSHGDATRKVNYTIPFVVHGPGVTRGNLYDLNDTLARPGSRRPSYRGAQPVRNAMVANLALDLLGLPALPGSGLNADQSLDVGPN